MYDVSIDACTEYTRQTIITSLNTMNLGYHNMFVKKDTEKIFEFKIMQGAIVLGKAADELKTYGIVLDLIQKMNK